MQAYFASKTTALVEDLIDPSLRREPYRPSRRRCHGFRASQSPGRCRDSDGAIRRAAARILIVSRRHRRTTRRAPGKSSRRSRAAPTGVPSPRTEIAGPARPRIATAPSSGGFESGIEMAIRSILMSPKFLFRVESQPPGIAPNTRVSASAISTWRRGCRSSSGAAFRTTSC